MNPNWQSISSKRSDKPPLPALKKHFTWGAKLTSTITRVDDLNTEGDDMQKVVLSDWWSVVGKMVNKAHGSQEAYGSSHNNNAKVHMTRKSFSPTLVAQPIQKHEHEKHAQTWPTQIPQ